MELLHYWRSSSSWRVRWALEIKGLQYKSLPINLLQGEEKQSTYLEKNPAGHVPLLIIEEEKLGESMAIMEWLEESYPEPSILYGNALERAQIRRLAETINSGTQPLQNLSVMKYVSSTKEKQVQWCQHWLERGLGVYESLLEKIHEPQWLFSTGNTPSIADCCLIPQCYNGERFFIAIEKFPKTYKIYTHALSTSACMAAHPDRFKT